MAVLMRVESNWNASSPLQTLLSINQQQPTQVEEDIYDNIITLTQPHPSFEQDPDASIPPCHVTIDCTQCQGHPLHNITGIQLTSGARTVEYYIGMDEVYCGSCRGTFIKLPDTDRDRLGRLYCCVIDLCVDDHTPFITIKMPSLKGIECVVLTKIVVTVSSSNGEGLATPPRPFGTGSHLEKQVDDVFSMLRNTQNAPPFVTGLLTALKTSTVSASNVNDLTAMFRQVHNPDTPSNHKDKILTLPTSKDNSKLMGDKETSTDEEDTIETRLKHYMDEKFLQLETHIDQRLQQMKQEILIEIHKNNNWKKD